jgi:hypothetical protein
VVHRQGRVGGALVKARVAAARSTRRFWLASRDDNAELRNRKYAEYLQTQSGKLERFLDVLTLYHVYRTGGRSDIKWHDVMWDGRL